MRKLAVNVAAITIEVAIAPFYLAILMLVGVAAGVREGVDAWINDIGFVSRALGDFDDPR